MKNCRSCGELVNSNAMFCNYCGENLQEDTFETEEVKEEKEKNTQSTEPEKPPAKDASENNTNNEPPNKKTSESSQSADPSTNNQQPTTQKSPSNKKAKIIIFSSIAAVLLLIGTFVLGNYLTSVNHLLDEFETAIGDKDKKKLADILTVDHKELELTDESLDNFIQLFESQPSELNYLMNHLTDQAKYGSTLTKMFPVDLMKDGKKFIFFDNYVLSVNPVYVKVSTNYKDTDIIINGEVLETTDTDDFYEDVGPLIPGEYVIEAIHDTGFFHLSKETNVRLTDPGYSQYADLYLDGRDVSFNLISNRYEDLKSIQLYINGKETGWNLAENDRVGPLLTDGSLNASFEAEFPWGTIRTNDFPINESYIDFNLGDSEEFKQEMMDIIIKFNEEFVEAFATADVSKLTTTTFYFAEALIDEIIFNMYMELEYEGAFHGLDFYMESFELKQDYDGFWNVTVDTIAYFEEAFYERGEKPALEQNEEELRYELVYDPQIKDWVVADIGFPGTMEEDKMERYKVSDPVIHSSDWAALEEEDLEE